MTKILKYFIIIFLTFGTIPNSFSQCGTTGMWFSTWYIMNGHYTWITGHGSGSNNQFLADVNGDGKSDAVVYFGSSGEWYVSISNGSTFNNYSRWIAGHGIGSNQQFLADFSGDGKADALVYSNSGAVYVSTSSGIGFNGYSQWASNIGVGATKMMAADVNGDGKTDLIAYNNGTWTVALSNGSSFNTPVTWITGHGSGSNAQYMGDFDGDGKADALVVFSSGAGYVATSNGNGFNGYSQWSSSNLTAATSVLIGDINNDTVDDIVFYSSNGNWNVSYTSNGSFGAQQTWKTSDGANATNVFLGDPIGEDKKATVSFLNGTWYILPNSSDYKEPFYWNLWDTWNIKYRPYTLGTYRQYDSGDTLVIQDQLSQLTSANVDYLLIDETNNIYVNQRTIFNRAMTVAHEIKKWNENLANRPIRYAFAIGGIQFSGDPNSIEYEAKEIWENVVNNADVGGTNTYQMLDGKPLLVCYYGQQAYLDAWNELSSHPWSQKFTMRWCNGSNPSTPGLYGWGIPNGSINSSNLMEVMPGWNNHQGAFVSRTYNGVEGDFYRKLCWDRVNAQMPDQIIINSFNEFAEETGMQTTNTDLLSGTSEKWSSPNFYWNMTANYISQYKVAKGCPTPSVSFTADKIFSETPTNIQFTQHATNGINYQWSFGDGSYSIDANPLHYYTSNGTYTVTLKVTGTGSSDTFTQTDYITIGCTNPTITPNIQVNGGNWTQATTATLCVGGHVSIGPQPIANTWSWTGPNNFTSNVRQIDLTNLQANQSGTYTANYTDANRCSAQIDFDILVDICTGVSSLTNGSISIYPNPTTNQITVNSGESSVNQIQISDVQGKVVYQSNESFIGNKTIDVSHLAKGLHLIKISGASQSFLQKIVVE